MPDPKMHPDEVDTDAELVTRLLAAQFPQWADLPVRRVASTGTDNAMFRLGAELCARLPRIEWAVGSLEREQRLLPKLAPHLPLAVPTPVAVGEPTAEYPYPWSVQPWIEGAAATRERFAESALDPVAVAVDLANFLNALQAVDTAGAPPPAGRGRPITMRDAEVREAVAELGAALDSAAVLAAWERVMDTPAWPGAPVWIHGDLQGGNLIARGGRLRAVIDFAPGIGDPAVNLLPAWNLFSGEAREAFRTALGVDDATWERGRGWALSVALVALPYYTRLGTNPRIVADSWHDIGEILKND
ncbi:MAG: aminoglycoside phosphotransferase family protein [Catenulispora sp.]